MITCSGCKKETAEKVLAFGLPMVLCSDESCSTLSGEPFATIYIVFLSPIEGMITDEFCFFSYEGSYLKALWKWMVSSGSEN